MKYLVTMEMIGAPPDSPEELLQYVEDKVIPTHEILLKWEAEKRILAGGDLSGRRGSVLILEAESNAEVSRLLATLPLWVTQEIDVIPLESFEERQAAIHHTLAKRLKSAVK
jgi:uncharacterized protein YciI